MYLLQSASDGGASVGRHTLRLARAMLDRRAATPLPCSAVDLLTDIFTSQNTPVRLPSMLSQFRYNCHTSANMTQMNNINICN